MDHILNTVLLCTVEDEQRFRIVIDDWIEKGEVEAMPKYSADTDKKKKMRKRKVSFKCFFFLNIGYGITNVEVLIYYLQTNIIFFYFTWNR